MARQKKNIEAEADPKVSSVLADALAAVHKSYGAVVRTPEEYAYSPQWISLTPKLDEATGGGIPEGSWVTMSGAAKTGKSTLALTYAVNAQRQGRHVFYYNVEHRIKERDLSGIKGLDISPDKFTLVESKESVILSSAKYLNICSDFVKAMPRSIHIFDSVSSMCGEKLITEGIESQDRASGYQVIGKFCDSMQSVVPSQRCVIIGIIQQIANTGGGPNAPKTKEKMPTKWAYQTDVWLQVTHTTKWQVGSGEEADQIGQEVHWNVKCHASGKLRQINKKAIGYLRYGTGYDRDYELLIMAQELAKITGTTWLTLAFLQGKPELLVGTDHEGKEEVKVQGKENAYRLLAEHPAWGDELERQLMENLL